MEKLKKYKTSNIGMVCLIGGDLVALVVYLCCLLVPEAETNKIILEIVTNFLVVLISVLSTSILSIPLIEVREKNSLCEQMLKDDVLRTPQFFNSLTESQKKDMLQALESALHFDFDILKGSMYASIRSKINSSFETDNCVYLASCEYKVRCFIENESIRKTILKKLTLCTTKPTSISEFPLCSMSFSETESKNPLQISYLVVDDHICSIDTEVGTIVTENDHPLSQKSGYTITRKHYYKNPLKLSEKKSTVIEVQYTTIVPKNDKSYICRVSTPCQKFKFEFYLEGENRNQYRISLCAFGFIDNGRGTPNLHDDTPSASIEFNDWIFPQDGVAVTILEKSQVPALCQ